MKIRKEFKEDMVSTLKWITIIFGICVYIGCVYYSYAHFLMDVLRLPTIPLVNKDIDPHSECAIFIHTLLYTVLFFVIYLFLDLIKHIYIKIKNYVFE